VARLFADENFPFPVVEALRHIGHDVVTVADAGKAGQSLTDKAILELATADQRAVVTLNRSTLCAAARDRTNPRRHHRVFA
jgi:predicted nuclease of predicted toxin-antitoxin system